ncbi:bacillithiol system redox-active protein YtxJ [Chitinophaga lutea]
MWIALESEEQLNAIQERSFDHPVVIFKHSTRCSISGMVKTRLERSAEPEGLEFYYLDLIRYRSVSNRIAELYGVEHESPQVLLIRNGECIYDESHTAISMEELAEQN